MEQELERVKQELAVLQAENQGLLQGWLMSLYTRDYAVFRYIQQGEGIEIGALHKPQRVPDTVKVKYVDRLHLDEMREHYPELDESYLFEPDIIDDGETLSTFSDESCDFVIANHFLEHCEDPIGALLNMLRIIRTEGILFITIPDKRFTFDKDRPITTLEHLIEDHEKGPERSKKKHYKEVFEEPKDQMEKGYSIHYHVWTISEIVELLTTLKQKYQARFKEELIVQSGEETMVVVRKK